MKFFLNNKEIFYELIFYFFTKSVKYNKNRNVKKSF